MSDKKYIAMMQCYEFARDAEGKVIYDERKISWTNTPQKYPRQIKSKGKFKGFGANGKVISLYDSPAKAARYCGKEGHVVEMDPNDCIRVGVTPEEAFKHCEARMLFWGQEADRLQALMKKPND